MPSIDFPLLRTQSDFPRRSPRNDAPRAGSAPTEILGSVNYPITPEPVFLPITVEIFAGDHPPNDDLILPPTTPSHSDSTYDDAIARLDELVSDSILTATDKCLLEAIMKTAQMFVAPGEVHSLLTTIGSAATPISQILDLVNTTTLGMRAFTAQPGPSSSSILGATRQDPRQDVIRITCASRDRSTCVVTGRRVGECCHVIPFSAATGQKAANFWAFVAMFKGQAGMQELRRMALGPRPFSTDTILNVLWLSSEVHQVLDKGQMAMVPLVTAVPYNPAIVAEVSFPRCQVSRHD